jgi:CDP-glycerol glycerophosphotransferase (TagB/SpsB family)
MTLRSKVKDFLYQLFRIFLTILNKMLPKHEKAIVQGFPNSEGSAIEVYNYLVTHKDLPVYYVVDQRLNDYPGSLLVQPRILEKGSLAFFIHYLTSKYVFFTHGSTLNSFSNKQVVVNIWHGLCYKPVGRIIGNRVIKTDLTVSTSEFTKPMFMKSFGVPYEAIIASGYPRNDILIREKANRNICREKLGIAAYDKVIIWLPTYRKTVTGELRSDGTEVGNPLYIRDFNFEGFEKLLKEHHAVCYIKPHPMAPQYGWENRMPHIRFINDRWLSDQGMTLYHLASMSDMLISDVSSIIADYLLMDKPIICVNEDFEEYKRSRGFYFDDIENWIPSLICKSGSQFLSYLEQILSSGVDPYETKRKEIKRWFFDHEDGRSAERLVEGAFSISKSPAMG